MFCVICGNDIPEGRMVCPICEKQTEELGNLYVKKYSVQSVVFPSMNSNPDGISADLFFKGCTLHCKGCHNLELQRFSEPNTSILDIAQAIHKNNVKILTLMGGEPLDVGVVLLCDLLRNLKKLFPTLKFGLFTGHELKDLSHSLVEYLDYIKVGKFDCEQLNPKGSFLASKNQHFYKVIEKLEDRVVLREYESAGYYVNQDFVLYF